MWTNSFKRKTAKNIFSFDYYFIHLKLGWAPSMKFKLTWHSYSDVNWLNIPWKLLKHADNGQGRDGLATCLTAGRVKMMRADVHTQVEHLQVFLRFWLKYSSHTILHQFQVFTTDTPKGVVTMTIQRPADIAPHCHRTVHRLPYAMRDIPVTYAFYTWESGPLIPFTSSLFHCFDCRWHSALLPISFGCGQKARPLP